MLPSRPEAVPTSDLEFLAAIALVSFVVTYFGTIVGLVLGHLRLALLVAWLGPVIGAATSLAISSVGALAGAVRHAREGRVELRLLLSLGAPSAAAAYLTATYAPRVDPALIKLTIAATLILSGGSMLVKSLRASAPAPAESPAPPRRRVLAFEALVGALFGALSGLVGLLLGTLRLPILLRLAATPQAAIGTNMAIGCFTGLVAGIATLRAGTVDGRAFLVLAPVTVLAANLGARTTSRLQRRTLELLIAVILVVTGVVMAVQLRG